MLITRKSQASGVVRTLDLPITPDQLRAWELGARIQHVMPHLDPDQREFLLTGIIAEEWNTLFPAEDC